MKRAFCALLTILLLGTSAIGAAAATLYEDEYTDVPSVMTQDSVIEFSAQPDGEVELLQPYEETVLQLEEIYDFVWKQGNRPVRYYDEETQAAIQALVPEIDIDILYMSEFMGLMLETHDEEQESISMRMEVTRDYYAEDRLMIAVMGIRGEDGEYRWYPYRCHLPEAGVICWEVPMEDYLQLASDRSVLHILTIRYGSGSASGEGQVQEPTETARPSKRADDLNRVDGWQSASGAQIDEAFQIYFVTRTEVMEREMLQISTYIEDGQAPIAWFPEEIQQQVREMKLNNVALEEMIVYDILAVQTEGYREIYGDVATQNRFPTSYRADKEMFALLGFLQEDGEMEWYYLRAEAIEDSEEVEIVYKQLVLPILEEQPGMLVLFSEPLIEEEAE